MTAAPGPGAGDRAAVVLDDDAEDRYEHAPCGDLSTLLEWLGRTRAELVGVLAGAAIVTTTVTLRPGDTVLLCTDGLTGPARASAASSGSRRC